VIPAIVLAAGKSTRMGRPKATLPLGGGDTFLSRIVRTFQNAGVDDILVVVGYQYEPIVESLARAVPAVRFVRNDEYERGQWTSLVCGLNTIDRPGVRAALMTLVDAPLVAAETVRAVIDRYEQTHAAIVRPVRAGQHGHPVLIDRALFDEIRRADPAAGAKPVIRAHVTAAGEVDVDDEGAFVDVDTPEEYQRIRDR
jgi:molybdenum cofactor cytidylyltransferase